MNDLFLIMTIQCPVLHGDGYITHTWDGYVSSIEMRDRGGAYEYAKQQALDDMEENAPGRSGGYLSKSPDLGEVAVSYFSCKKNELEY